jgi:hypothetical protein
MDWYFFFHHNKPASLLAFVCAQAFSIRHIVDIKRVNVFEKRFIRAGIPGTHNKNLWVLLISEMDGFNVGSADRDVAGCEVHSEVRDSRTPALDSVLFFFVDTDSRHFAIFR